MGVTCSDDSTRTVDPNLVQTICAELGTRPRATLDDLSEQID